LKYAGDINIDDEMLKNVDTYKFGEKKPDHIIRYHVKNMYNTFFKDESIATQAQLLRGLIRSKKLKEATSLLGIQKSTKDTKVKQNVFENITSALKSFGKSRKKDVSVARRVIQTTIVPSSNIKYRLTQHMEKAMGTSRKTLYKHRQF
jgi:ABC-type ATPase with predicted acetyltransferase domain